MVGIDGMYQNIEKEKIVEAKARQAECMIKFLEKFGLIGIYHCWMMEEYKSKI